jgi:hypothetical protein
MKVKIAKWCLDNDHAVTVIFVLLMCSLVFVLSFIVCAVIEYNNCNGILSFIGYDFTEMIDFGVFRSPAITPVFECTQVN